MKHKKQMGYLMEMPLLIAAIAIILAIVLPKLHDITMQNIVLMAGILLALPAIYYMLFTPGWLPNRQVRSGRSWYFRVLLIVVAVILFFFLAY